jgi:transposase
MIVMGLDQHRGQITAEWIDTSSGEVRRARVAPAHREPVARFLGRFRGAELEVPLEATTGWRFVVEEIRAVGGRVHLAEPAETAARRGNKKRAKSDRADARHLRELLMISRLPESWIPPDHILDLRARVRSRHTLSEQRGEWQQRIQAVLYHHGLPARRQLMTAEGRLWLSEQPLPAVAREQVGVAIAMVDALDVQLAPLDRELRAYARRQPGCRALMAHYGIGELDRGHDSRRAGRLPALFIVAPRGPLRGAGHHRPSVRSAARARAPVAPGPRRRCAGRCSRPPRSPAGPPAPTATTTPRPPNGSAQTAPA